MAILKKIELKQFSKTAIDEKVTELKKELMKLNAQRIVGTAVENPGRIKELRKSIAKLLTIKNQSTKLGEENKKG